MNNWFRITCNRFTAGGDLARVFNEFGQKTRCAYAAPIIGYMNGWDEKQIQSYCNHRGWKVEFFA